MKHGILAKALFKDTPDGAMEKKVFEELRTRMWNHYNPVGPIEELLVGKLVMEWFRYSRLLAREQQQLILNPLAFAMVVDPLVRYQVTINRQISQALERLQSLQALRKANPKSSEPFFPGNGS